LPMRVLMVASEARPFAMTGGLADVLGSLPAALREMGHEVAALIPRYRRIALGGARPLYDHLPVWIGSGSYACSVYQRDGCYFLDCPELYDREAIYGTSRGDYSDNHIRFAVLSRAALEFARRIFRPQVIHCHDWQAALVSAYLRTRLAGDPTFAGIKTLFTIHNLGYQGLFPRSALADVALDDSLFHPEGIEFFGRVNFMKAGILFSDALNTVSPAYAREIQTPEFGFGLDGLLRKRASVLSGILNGVDYRVWNPETDPAIAAHYSRDDMAGKRVCKEALLREFGFPPEAPRRPLIGAVTRLADQKGADLIAAIGEDLAREDASLVLLGSGDHHYEDLLTRLALAHPGRVAVRIGYDDKLAHRIEAGADIFLMPSRYEPCGLNQMYSLRYGTVPIVRATGGLVDTVEGGLDGTGILFESFHPAALLAAIRRGLALYADPPRLEGFRRRGMQRDFSWTVSARRYESLFTSLLKE
jgi:starch synthase